MVIFKGPEAIKQLLISESPGKPWDTFVLAAARISSGFRDLRVYNRGAPGLQKPQLLFQTKTDPRITYSNGNFLFSRKKWIQTAEQRLSKAPWLMESISMVTGWLFLNFGEK